MPEQKLSYEEKVDKAAETYANSYNSYVDFDIEYKDKSDFLYEGRKAVSAQAEAIREALWKFYEDGEMRDDVDENMLSYLINEHLNEHGYIEPKTEEDD